MADEWDDLYDEELQMVPLRLNAPLIWFPDQDPGPNHPLEAYFPRTISIPPSPRYNNATVPPSPRYQTTSRPPSSYNQVSQPGPSQPKSSAALSSTSALPSTATSPFKDPTTPATPLFPNDYGSTTVLDWTEAVPDFYSTPYKSALESTTATPPAVPFIATPNATSSIVTPHATSFFAQGRQWNNGTFKLEGTDHNQLCSYLISNFFTPNNEWSDPISYDTLIGKKYDEATRQHLLSIDATAYNWLADPLLGPPTGVAKLLAMMPVDILKLPAIATDLPNFNIHEDQVLRSGEAALERRSAELQFNHKNKNLDSKKLYWGLGYDPFEGEATLEAVKEGWATMDQLQVPSVEPATSAQPSQPPPTPASPSKGFSYNYDDDDDDDDDDEDEEGDAGNDAEDLLRQ